MGSSVDTSRPFSSVKEAVAIFGERLLVGEIYSPKPQPDTPPISTKGDQKQHQQLEDVIKKLEAELHQTKHELKLLKERGTDTDVALATLNAQLHKNMSNFAQAEASAAGKAASKTVRFEIAEDHHGNKMGHSPKLAHILGLGENDHLFGGKDKGRKQKQKQKQKPIIPLVGDLFFKRKPSSTTNHHNPLYASPF